MKLLPMSIATRLMLTVMVLVALGAAGFLFAVRSLDAFENILDSESSEHIDLLTTNSVVSRQVFELTTRVQLLEQAFLYNESVLTQEGFNIDQQLLRMRDLSADAAFTTKMDRFIEDFHRFLGNSLALNHIIRETKEIDETLAEQIDQLDLMIANQHLAQPDSVVGDDLSHDRDLIHMLRETFLDTGKMVGSIRSRITPETEKVGIIEVQKELDIFQLHLANLALSNHNMASHQQAMDRSVHRYMTALRKMQANLDQRWNVMNALMNSQNELLTLVESTEANVQNSALGLKYRLQNDIRQSRLIFMALAIIVLFISLFMISYVVRRHVREPLEKISEGLRQFEASEFSQRISLHRNDEWDRIERAFNKMADRLQQSYGQINQEKKNFDFLAHHDPLTKLSNRLFINKYLNQQIELAKDGKQSHFALLYMDIDEFKTINDSLGHGAGDKLLIDIADVLSSEIHELGTVARMGGDEFMVLLPDIRDQQEAEDIAASINSNLRRPYFLEDKTVFVSASIGLCMFPQHGNQADTLVRNADTAMYHAKRRGRDQYCVYNDDMTLEAKDHIDVSAGLHRAINNGELELVFQPQYRLSTETIIGAEALIRWNHPEHGYLGPMSFLAVAEKTGLINLIDDWVFRQMTSLITEWQRQGICLEGLKFAINFSGRKFLDEKLVEQLTDMISTTDCKPEQLVLEITERDVMSSIDTSAATIKRLREKGYRIAIDDFGTGHSSLALLKNLPVNTIKLDRSFIQDIASSERDLAIVRSVLTLTSELKLGTVAEGIECREQAEKLKELNCPNAQGYLFSKPLSIDDWLALIQQQNQQSV
ncbi:putative bifunctional diguanylate cyclase/phosphodiesterase [Oceanobacter kriegii]|uniref:putative bifunctional diguanylate cyclase/phosphodiesterase n=1 Tax=Oceanobacter kriegii TaxID=64972 RepID=UPI0004024B46|nr:EAL domain-containing protein [Oceanobacter kriegii]